MKEVKGYRLKKEDLAHCIIICHNTKGELKKTKLLAYIKQGEEQGYHERPTCASRGRGSWYMLGKNWRYAPLIFPAKVGERMPIFLNDQVFEDKKLYGVTPKDSDDVLLLAGLLNSTLSRFFVEFSARQLTGSQAIADIDVVVVEELLIPYARKAFTARIKKQIEKAFEKLAQTPAESVFKEIAQTPSEVSLNRVKAERRELDRIIMSEVLGLSEDEQLEVYRAVVDLVRTRLDKAKSFGKRAKLKDGMDVEKLKKVLIEEYDNGE